MTDSVSDGLFNPGVIAIFFPLVVVVVVVVVVVMVVVIVVAVVVDVVVVLVVVVITIYVVVNELEYEIRQICCLFWKIQNMNTNVIFVAFI